MITTENTENERLAVEQTLQAWYTHISKHDLDAVAAALAPGFLLVENTELITRDKLLDNFREGFKMGTQTAQLSDFHTVVHGDVAWTTQHNAEVWVGNNGAVFQISFIETVVLQKSADQRWLLERYQASPLVPAAPAATEA